MGAVEDLRDDKALKDVKVLRDVEAQSLSSIENIGGKSTSILDDIGYWNKLRINLLYS